MVKCKRYGGSRDGEAKKERKAIYDKPISIPVPFEDTLRDLLVPPPFNLFRGLVFR
jgi:hypothetical protein